jgi:16S rRNA (guanine966-N2)-methyltransferase
MSRKRKSPPTGRAQELPREVERPLRIIGGRLRGHAIQYSGDPRTRPMKERVREALFNLVGPAVNGMHALDLFAGTGALGLEALSRGAERATFIERHFPTARLIEANIAALGLAGQSHVNAGDAFLWARLQRDWSELNQRPWLILCSPPFDFYTTRQDDMRNLVSDLYQRAPRESILVVESDEQFDFETLAELGSWDVRTYPPAVIGIVRKEPEPTPTAS